MFNQAFFEQLKELDIRVESLVAALLDRNSFSRSHIIIQPKSSFSRNYAKDIISVDYQENKKSAVTIQISREGLYDMLPEGLFHKTVKKDALIDTETSVKEIKMHQEEEKAARKFFLPLEQAFYWQRVQLELEERKLWSPWDEKEYNQFLISFWQLESKDLNQHQTATMLALLPFAHHIAGNLPLTEEAISIILGEKVRITRLSSNPTACDNPLVKKLGYTVLGTDLFLGDHWYDDNPVFSLEIGPVSANKLPQFLPEGEADKVLESLYNFLMPADVDVITTVSVREEEQDFILSDDPVAGILNYTTTI